MATHGTPAQQTVIEIAEWMGEVITRSQLTGCKSKEHGRYVALTCLARGCDPQYIASRYDIMPKQMRMKSVTMLAEFRRRGGKHKIIERSAERAAVELVYDGNSHVFEFTWEEVKDEDFTTDRDGETKDNYATPVKRRTMLWYRVVSDAVTVVCPEVLDDVNVNESNWDWSKLASTSRFRDPRVANTEPFLVGPQAGSIYAKTEANPVAVAEESAKPNETVAVSAPPDSQEKGDSKPSDDVGESTSARVDGPCTKQQANDIRTKLSELKAAGVTDAQHKIKAALVAKGKQTLDDLSMSQADKLLVAIEKRQIEDWAEKAISDASSGE